MTILLINHYAGSMKHGMEFRPYCLAREWVKAGHAVRIVAASFSHLRQKQPQITGPVTREEIEGILYCWIKTPSYAGNSIMRVVNIFTFLLRVMFHRRSIVKDFAPDLVIGSSTYPLDNIIVHSIARRFQARHVYELHDLWPLSLIELGGMSPRHPFVMLMAWAEHYAYASADAVISLLPFAESHMIEHGLERNKFFYVPNGVDSPDEKGDCAELPPLHASVLGELKRKKMFIVGYAGGHAISNALESFVASAIYLRHSPVALVLVGSGAEKEHLMNLAKKLELSNVYFLPPVSRTAVQPLLERMDVLFIGWKNKPIYRYGVSPNKLMDYMLSSKPILHANGVGNDIVAECGCGISVPPEDPKAIARAVRRFMKMDEETRSAIGRKGRAYLLQEYQNKDLARKFIDRCSAAALSA